MVCLHGQGEERHRQGLGGQEGQDRPLQGSRRKRPGDDVADDDEPGDAPPHPRHAGGHGAHRAGVRPAAGRRPERAEKPHCGARCEISRPG